MDSIRLAVLEAFYAFPRGGAEVGGVLFGTFDGAQVTIATSRDLACEHALGPSFVLSEKDRSRLNDLLRAADTNPDLRGFVPVGWYHSHTRTDIFLSGQDLEIHGQFFPEPWQIALVLRPSITGTRAGFFVRDGSGNLRADSSYRVFPLVPLSGRSLARAAQSASEPAVAAAAPASAPAAFPAPLEPEPSPAPAVAAFDPVSELLPPSFLIEEPRRPGRLWAWAVLASAVLVSAGIYATREYWVGLLPYGGASQAPAAAVPPRPEPVDVAALDHGGQLQITWNRTAGPVLRARSGALDIRDGGALTTIMIDPERLRTGAITYVRQTERVEVRLALEQPDGKHITGFASFVGKPPEAAAPLPAADDEVRSQRDELQAQLREARTQLVNQSLLIQRLQQIIREMQAPKPAAPPQAPETPRNQGVRPAQ